MEYSKNIKDYNKFIDKLIAKGINNHDPNLTYWGYVISDFSNLFMVNRMFKPGMKFVDLGCGAGNILRFAKNVGYDVTGVEFDKSFKSYLKTYKHLIQDMTLLDNDFYKEFDVIYVYRPLKDNLKDYMNTVVSNMKVGAYIISPLDVIVHDELKFADIGVYQKIAI